MPLTRPSRPPATKPGEPPPAMRVGIALGTQRVAVAAANGAREHFGSVVGTPRSASARRMLGRDVVFGAEAYRLRAALDLVRPFEAGALPGAEQFGSSAQLDVHRTAAAQAIAQAVKLARPVPGERVKGVIAVPGRVARESRGAVAMAAREAMDVISIVPEAWTSALAAGAPAGAIVLDFGAGGVTVCRAGPEPPKDEEIFALPGGGDDVDLEILSRLRGLLPELEGTVALARELKERFGLAPEADSAIVALPAAGGSAPVDVREPVARACEAGLGKVLEAARALWPQGAGEATVVLAGGGGGMKGLEKEVEEGMGRIGRVKVVRVGDAVMGGAEGALLVALSK